MDDKTRDLALKYMQKASENRPRPDRFPVTLPESQEQMVALLLGTYGSVVEDRNMDFSMDDATVSKVEKVVRWMYESRKMGLLLCGTLGNGKTTMLRTINRLFGTHAVFIEAQAVYDYYRQNQSLPSVPSNYILLVDDLGVEPATYNDFGVIRYPLAELLMQRYNNNSMTLIATNYTFEQLGETYGDRLQDRMREMYAMITYCEPSYRK